MPNVTQFDSLALAVALRDEAGFDQRQAEGTAKVFSRLLVAELATKNDLAASTAELKTELKAELAVFRAELLNKIETSSAATQAALIKWLFGFIVAQSGIIIAALRLLH